MGIINLPKKFVKRDDLNSWYRDGTLSKYPLVDHYLGKWLQYWIKHLSNPFEIYWIRLLYENKIDYLEDIQKHLEENIGRNDMKELFCEIFEGVKDPIEISRKIGSISTEMRIYKYIREKYNCKNIKKIHKIGDWNCDNKIISVKGKEPISTPYENVENIILSLAYIEENRIIRQYNEIDLKNFEGLGYKDLNSIYYYIRKELISDLIESDNKLKLNNGYFSEEKEINNNIILKIDVNINKKYRAPIQFSINFNNQKSINIQFRKGNYVKGYDIISTGYGAFSCYRNGQEIKLDKYVIGKINEICDNDKKPKPDILWIDIELHPSFVSTIKTKIAQEHFRDIINRSSCVKTILSFYNIYDSNDKTIILE